ncbi:MAG: hypothetical protein LH485_04150 [Sphingomonas bacterium]|nr:hypothetical protein [Sphingomonas bacterium]
MSGYYSSSTGRGQFSCIFYFSGTLRKGRARIDSYFPGALPSDHISGIATLTRGGAAIIALEKEHGGCWNVQHFADKSYLAKFQLAAPYRWRSIRVVRAARAYFYDAPGIPKHRAAYVVRGDGVGVLASANESNREWIKVDFVGEPNSQSGWLRKSDLYPD